MPQGPILVVDDDPANLDVMRQILGKEYRLAFANGGAAALEAVKKHRPCLVLLDVSMPEVDGYAVCQHLKADPSTMDIPVIFVTAQDDVDDEMAGFDLGAVDYITKPPLAPLVRARVRTHLQLVRAGRLEEAYWEAITMLGKAGHYNDTDTGVHIWRMAAYAGALARAAGWNEEASRELEAAAAMHDTGKVGVPSGILKKPGKLDADEWEVMKTHCKVGHAILSQSRAPVFQLAAEVALRHHEHWNGLGYPDGLAAESIPESARIVAVADIFDALTMKRPYKDAWPVDQALDTLRKLAGQQLEPRLVELFVAILPDIMQLRDHWNEQESRPDPPPALHHGARQANHRRRSAVAAGRLATAHPGQTRRRPRR